MFKNKKKLNRKICKPIFLNENENIIIKKNKTDT